MERKQIWIDTDLSVGMKRTHREGYCDVDDGYAVWQLMNAPDIKILGISAVFGNTSIDNAFMLSQYMADNFSNYHIPVFKGAGSGIVLGNVETNDGVEAMAVALQKQKLTIMAIGPATNVGILLLKHPHLASQIEEVVLVAGRRKPTDYFKIGNKGNHARDLNFDLDNFAFQIMFEAKINVVLCPFEISNKVWINKSDLDQLEKGGNESTKWLAEKSRIWLQQWLDQGAEGFNPFDVLASHYIIDASAIISETLNARLEIHLDDTIKENDSQTFKQYLLCDHEAGYPVKYCYDVVLDYHDQLIKSLLN